MRPSQGDIESSRPDYITARTTRGSPELPVAETEVQKVLTTHASTQTTLPSLALALIDEQDPQQHFPTYQGLAAKASLLKQDLGPHQSHSYMATSNNQGQLEVTSEPDNTVVQATNSLRFGREQQAWRAAIQLRVDDQSNAYAQEPPQIRQHHVKFSSLYGAGRSYYDGPPTADNRYFQAHRLENQAPSHIPAYNPIFEEQFGGQLEYDNEYQGNAGDWQAMDRDLESFDPNSLDTSFGGNSPQMHRDDSLSAIDPGLSAPKTPHMGIVALPASQVRNEHGSPARQDTCDRSAADRDIFAGGLTSEVQLLIPPKIMIAASALAGVNSSSVQYSTPSLGRQSYRQIAPKLAPTSHPFSGNHYQDSVPRAPVLQSIQHTDQPGFQNGVHIAPQQLQPYRFQSLLTPTSFQPPSPLPQAPRPRGTGPRNNSVSTRVNNRAHILATLSSVQVPRYLDQLHDAPPLNVQWPPGMPISVVELLAFAPSSFQVPQLGHRAFCNDFRAPLIAYLILQPRGRLNAHGAFKCAYERLKYQIQKDLDHVLGTRRFTMKKDGNQIHPVQPPYNTNSWTGRGANSFDLDPLLRDMGRGVISVPTGDDAWHLTFAVRYAQQHHTEPWKLSQVMEMVADPAKGFPPLPACHALNNCDQLAVARHLPNVPKVIAYR